MAEDPISIKQALSLKPSDAMEAFQRRDELKISVSWRDLQPEEHARAFTVAKVAKLDLLADIGGSLNKALAEGQSYDQWKAGILPTLKKAGWWGRVQNRDLTGTDEAVFVGDRRLKTIFRTNMRVAYAAGEWERIQRSKEHSPYLEYTAVRDRRTRPQHAAWHGIILPVDHPFWRTHFPPNGWNCRCGVIPISRRSFERRGLKVTSEEDLARLAPTDPVAQMPFGRGAQRVLRPKTPRIDHGWDYNVGAESMLGLVEKAAATIQRARAAGLTQAAEDLLIELATALSDDLLKLLLRLIDEGIEPGSEAWEDAVAASRKRRRGKRAGGTPIGDSYPNGGRRGQARAANGRFADEGGPQYRSKRDAVRVAHTQHWVDDTLNPRAIHMGNHPVGGLSPSAVERMRKAGLEVDADKVWLSPSHTVHIIQTHGGAREGLRGQVPITAEDLHNSAKLLNGVGEFKLSTGFRGQHQHSAPRATGSVVHGGYKYDLLIEEVRIGIVVRNMWKWRA